MTVTEAGGAGSPFDLAGPLPGAGVTVLEASAGTGKTYVLTSLITRFVAEGRPLSTILAVTFTRMATGEMRERVRGRMREVLACLSDPSDSADDDAVVSSLRGRGGAGVEESCRFLADALADFDSATIATTHGFCRAVLEGLGTAGDAEPGSTLVEDPTDLLDRVVDDLYARWALSQPPEVPLPGPAVVRRAAGVVVSNPGSVVVPSPDEDAVAWLAVSARDELRRRLQAANSYTYDDILERVADLLGNRQRGGEACRRLRDRFGVILVDEFQDTDPVQWKIIRTAFASPDCTLVLIGDPKQAVYGFRGADVHAYIEASRRAARRFTLGYNWRSCQPLLDALEALLDPCQFGHPEIVFRRVVAAPGHEASRLAATPVAAPLRFRIVGDNQRGVRRTTARNPLMRKQDLERWVAADVAADVSRLLASPATVGERPLHPEDVAVLTRTNLQALAVRDALTARGVTAVVGGADSVFASEAATEWVRLLQAVAEPGSASRASAVALTSFIGMTPTEVATAADPVWEELHERLQRWSGVLTTDGVATFYRTVLADTGASARILSRPRGERLMTDIEHVAELLHAEAAGRPGGFSLLAWLQGRRRSAGREMGSADERARRLESDRRAVQVLTIHRAKGLEFPVVYCPFLWAYHFGPTGAAPRYHDDDGRPSIDVRDPASAGSDPEYEAHKRAGAAEEDAEELRLLYVALTRAAQQVVLWWGRTSRSGKSPLGRLLFCRDPRTGAAVKSSSPVAEPYEKMVRDRLAQIAANAGGQIVIETAGDSGGEAGPGGGPSFADHDLSVAAFTRTLDLFWGRHSYTGITSGVHRTGAQVAPVTSEPEAPGKGDEPDDSSDLQPASPGSARPVTAASVPLTGVVGGRAFGTAVHSILETSDFTDPASLEGQTRRILGAVRFASTPAPDVVAAALIAATTTPLGPLAGFSLAEVGVADRIDEMAFELPLAGGEHPADPLGVVDLAETISAHLGDSGPLAGYGDRLADPALAGPLRGYLTGSIDLLLRRPGPRGGRWFLVDYKTNRLGDDAWDYRWSALDEEMQRHHYPLQALLYSVAAHRYLSLRIPGFTLAANFGGVIYAFVRGMCGPATPHYDGQPAGVWSWRPPDTLVSGLSSLLDAGRPAGASIR